LPFTGAWAVGFVSWITSHCKISFTLSCILNYGCMNIMCMLKEMPQPYSRILICVKTSFLIMMSTSDLLVDDSLTKGCTNAGNYILQDGA